MCEAHSLGQGLSALSKKAGAHIPTFYTVLGLCLIWPRLLLQLPAEKWRRDKLQKAIMWVNSNCWWRWNF
jgi:hypothetical protein